MCRFSPELGAPAFEERSARRRHEREISARERLQRCRAGGEGQQQSTTGQQKSLRNHVQLFQHKVQEMTLLLGFSRDGMLATVSRNNCKSNKQSTVQANC